MNDAPAAPIRVVLLDDHASFREPLAFMLGREDDLEVVGQVDSLSAAREFLRGGEPEVDVAVVDLDLPDGSGVEFVAWLRDERPEVGAMVLSALSDRVRLAQAIEAGAAGVIHKSSRLGQIVESVRRLYSGADLLSHQEVFQALRLVDGERARNREANRKLESLTPRELDVLKALADGSNDKEIASRLYVGVGTVHTHVSSILSKLEARSRLEALVFAVRHGLVEID
jgi:DNA-binding NarL/FixJ family response regulator